MEKEKYMSDEKKAGLDLVGFGKIAEAIPKEVYVQSSETLNDTFTKLIAPITATTEGFGRYLKQKFDNMVEAEKALATYSVEKALAKAKEKAEKQGIALIPPSHPKSFIKSIEEASKETDPLLHEMWTNLLATQISEPNFHPHFVEILPILVLRRLNYWYHFWREKSLVQISVNIYFLLSIHLRTGYLSRATLN